MRTYRSAFGSELLRLGRLPEFYLYGLVPSMLLVPCSVVLLLGLLSLRSDPSLVVPEGLELELDGYVLEPLADPRSSEGPALLAWTTAADGAPEITLRVEEGGEGPLRRAVGAELAERRRAALEQAGQDTDEVELPLEAWRDPIETARLQGALASGLRTTWFIPSMLLLIFFVPTNVASSREEGILETLAATGSGTRPFLFGQALAAWLAVQLVVAPAFLLLVLVLSTLEPLPLGPAALAIGEASCLLGTVAAGITLAAVLAPSARQALQVASLLGLLPMFALLGLQVLVTKGLLVVPSLESSLGSWTLHLGRVGLELGGAIGLLLLADHLLQRRVYGLGHGDLQG